MVMAGGMYGLTLEKFLIVGMAGMTSGLESETLTKLMLVQDAYTPDFDAHDFRNDVTNEAAIGGTYSAGGNVLTTTELTPASPAATQLKWSAANPTAWTGTTGTARGDVIYYVTGGASSTDPVLAANTFGSDVTTAGGTFTLTWAANGILYFDYA